MAIDWRAKAADVWPHLVRYAFERRTATYGELAKETAIFHRNLRLALDPIGQWCFRNKLPPLTIVIVDADTGRPGSGIVGTSEATLDEDLARAFGHDWAAVTNPFRLFRN